jgi:hypothetical protein
MDIDSMLFLDTLCGKPVQERDHNRYVLAALYIKQGFSAVPKSFHRDERFIILMIELGKEEFLEEILNCKGCNAGLLSFSLYCYICSSKKLSDIYLNYLVENNLSSYKGFVMKITAMVRLDTDPKIVEKLGYADLWNLRRNPSSIELLSLNDVCSYVKCLEDYMLLGIPYPFANAYEKVVLNFLEKFPSVCEKMEIRYAMWTPAIIKKGIQLGHIKHAFSESLLAHMNISSFDHSLLVFFESAIDLEDYPNNWQACDRLLHSKTCDRIDNLVLKSSEQPLKSTIFRSANIKFQKYWLFIK